jgi:hypothetical protein
MTLDNTMYSCEAKAGTFTWAMGGAVTAAVVALVLLIRRWLQWSSAQASA